MGLMLETVEISVSCSSCSSAVVLPRTARDDAPAHCGGCGAHLGDWADVREQARAAVFDALRDDFTDVLARSSAPARPHLSVAA